MVHSTVEMGCNSTLLGAAAEYPTGSAAIVTVGLLAPSDLFLYVQQFVGCAALVDVGSPYCAKQVSVVLAVEGSVVGAVELQELFVFAAAVTEYAGDGSLAAVWWVARYDKLVLRFNGLHVALRVELYFGLLFPLFFRLQLAVRLHQEQDVSLFR